MNTTITLKGSNNKTVLACFFTLLMFGSMAQPFSHADSLRGSNGPGRNWWNITFYSISVNPDLDLKTITGKTDIVFKVIKPGKSFQLDLQQPLVIDSILLSSTRSPKLPASPEDEGLKQQPSQYAKLDFIRDNNIAWVTMPALSKGSLMKITVYYHGKPREAVTPPWDGGWIWKKDKKGRPFVSVACQGTGASCWYPCKDYQEDEPDNGANLIITVPDTLIAVGNGRLCGETDNHNGTKTWCWAVSNPINNYNLVPYIGKYVHLEESYPGEKGNLTLDYWVLDYNESVARSHMQPDVKRMLKAFEYWFGPYPFYEDGYKIVDAPHLGMEHQSAIAYGNGYRNGYMNSSYWSGTPWGLKWDYIIIHESGHEWFANNITTKDIADMWVHEGFTTYTEVLFTEYYYGKKAAEEYIQSAGDKVSNDKPVIGHYGVNDEGGLDMYIKGAKLIHTIRQLIGNDSLFRKIMRGLNREFYHKTITSRDVESYISKVSKIKLDKIFDQYLRTKDVPVLEYKTEGFNLRYRFTNCRNDFGMPLKIRFKGERWIKATTKWKTLSLYPEGDNRFSVDPNFYINTKKVD